MAVDEYVRYYPIVAFHTTSSVVQHIAEGYYLIQLCIPLFFSDNQYNNIFSLILDHNNNWHGGSNDVTFSANEFDEINNKETKKNLLNSAVLGILTRFSSGFRVWLDSKSVDGIQLETETKSWQLNCQKG